MDGVVVRFANTTALDGFDLDLTRGEILGLLGPNGSGKTTAVKVLCTLLSPDEGTAEVFGLDVRSRAADVRERIALTGQYAAVDELLTGRQNLAMFGRLFGMKRGDARKRAGELLERFDLTDAADRVVQGYSGGMRRRLDLASALLTDPDLLFLDEPTTGLDPRSRNTIWEVVGDLASGGATILLTTQYLEEADRLADRITVMDHGRAIATGTAEELKERSGGLVIHLRVGDSVTGDDVREALIDVDVDGMDIDRIEEVGSGSYVIAPDEDPLRMLGEVSDALAGSGVEVRSVGMKGPDLDDVFLRLTGDSPDRSETGEPEPDGGGAQGDPSAKEDRQ